MKQPNTSMLNNIPVIQLDSGQMDHQLEGQPPNYDASGEAFSSLNIKPIMHEVRHALARLIATDETTTIDLQSIPFAPGEVDIIREHLGEGEVVIQVNALGPSTLSETKYAGVWWIEHRNNADEVTGLYIDITRVPTIVSPPPEDLADGLSELSDYLQGNVDYE